jgi:hypothetical protein
MHGFIDLMTNWLDDVMKIDSPTLTKLMQMGSKVQKFLEIKDRVKGVFVAKTRDGTASKSKELSKELGGDQ